ncbi:PspC domain-containing protein [Nanchangia anserum]|nr:PspC domain-containing protein [Nanchangia anserum]
MVSTTLPPRRPPLLRPGRVSAPGVPQRYLGGVCAGISLHTGVPIVWVRVIFLVAVLVYGIGIGAYLLLLGAGARRQRRAHSSPRRAGRERSRRGEPGRVRGATAGRSAGNAQTLGCHRRDATRHCHRPRCLRRPVRHRVGFRDRGDDASSPGDTRTGGCGRVGARVDSRAPAGRAAATALSRPHGARDFPRRSLVCLHRLPRLLPRDRGDDPRHSRDAAAADPHHRRHCRRQCAGRMAGRVDRAQRTGEVTARPR